MDTLCTEGDHRTSICNSIGSPIWGIECTHAHKNEHRRSGAFCVALSSSGYSPERGLRLLRDLGPNEQQHDDYIHGADIFGVLSDGRLRVILHCRSYPRQVEFQLFAELGGACSTLGWISALQDLYDHSGVVQVPVPNFTIPAGYEAREHYYYTQDYWFQSFDCQVNGVAQKTLRRTRMSQYNRWVQVVFLKLRDCNEEDPPGGSGDG